MVTDTKVQPPVMETTEISSESSAKEIRKGADVLIAACRQGSALSAPPTQEPCEMDDIVFTCSGEEFVKKWREKIKRRVQSSADADILDFVSSS